jgi:IclR family transcriptional regulator, KDG regulon repressor
LFPSTGGGRYHLDRSGAIVPRPRTELTPDIPKVLAKSLQVLEAFDSDTPRWSESDLRRRLGIPSSTLHRILRALEETGYVLRDDGGHYRLGIASVRLGQRAAASLDIAAVLDPELRQLAAHTEELVLLAVPEMSAGLARYVGAIDSPKRLRVTAELGSAVPLTAGATAKTLLAFAPQAQVESVLRRRRERLAPGTVISAKALRDQLDTISRRGWGLSWEETYDGAWAVAAPVLAEDGRAVASIGVAAPISRHSREREQTHRQAVIATAARASARLAPDTVLARDAQPPSVTGSS